LIESTQSAYFWGCIEEDFDLGVRKNHGPDIPALHYHPAPCANLLLQPDHPSPDGRKDTHSGGCVRYRLIAKQTGYILTVEKNAVCLFAGDQLNTGLSREPLQCGLIVQADVCPKRFQSEGAIHCACFQIEQAKMASKVSSDGTLSRARRSVDSDDELGCRIGGSQGLLIRAHPRFFVSRIGRAEKPNRVLFPTFVPAVNAGLRLVRAGLVSGRASFLGAALLRVELELRTSPPLRDEEPGLAAVLVPLAWPFR